jgi:phosphocarrier protein
MQPGLKVLFIGSFFLLLHAMLRETIVVENQAGLHTRPAAKLVKLASKFKSEFSIYRYGYQVNGKSILGVLTLAAECGAELELEFDGPDEAEAMEAIKKFFASKFSED